MREHDYLRQYNSKPSVTVDIIIFSLFEEACNNYRKLPEKSMEVLLVRRGKYPYKGMYALPGGFLKPNETLESAAFRELQEETGAKCDYLQQLRTFSEPDRDPRQRVITCAYTALVDGASIKVLGGTDVKTAEWFKVHLEANNEPEHLWTLSLSNGTAELRATMKENAENKVNEFPGLEIIYSNGLAFDHALIIAYAVLKLRQQINLEPIAFTMLPDRFTLTEAQKAYEAILGRKLYTQAFRRKIAEFVAETSEYAEKGGHRPSKLYRRKQTFIY